MNCWKFIFAVLMTLLFSYSTSHAQSAGQIRYNTSSNVLQIYDGSSWGTVNHGVVGYCVPAVNGVCNNATRNACSAGVSNDGAYADTSTEYRWRCDGQYGGTNSGMCSKLIPITGVCNNGTQNSCTAGTANDGAVADTSTEYRWRCDGQGGGTNSGTCTAPKTINGVCNNAVQNGCSAGTANDGAVADTSTEYRWRCDGQNGGTNSGMCSKLKTINGVCNNGTQNSCVTGAANDGAVADTSTEYRWRCDGQGGGTNSGTCTAPKTINGSCGSAGSGSCTTSQPGSSQCSTGTYADVSDTGTLWRWSCNGQGGGTNASCSRARCQSCGATTISNCNVGAVGHGASSGSCVSSGSCSYTCNNGSWSVNSNTCAGPVNGVCNNAARNACTAGTSNDGAIADTSTHYRWRCDGQNGGSNSGTCSYPKPVNGVCNNGTQNSCTAGAANDGAVADTSTEYRWRCDGQYGGTNSGTCTAPKTINGVCNNAVQNGCSAGTSNDGAYADTSTEYRWRCDGQGGGTNSGMCSKLKTINGVCNNGTQNSCVTGAANDGAVADTSTEYRWRCDGQGGGSNSGTCTAPKPINGVCNNATRNACTAGTSNDGAVADTSVYWRWRCDGQYGGSNSGTCQLNKPVNGVCNNATRNACTAGTSNDGAVADTSVYWRWRCDGQYGGSNSGTCQLNKPVNGVCNNAVQNGCSAGSANDGAVADTSTEYRWRCDGQYGGTNSGTCSHPKLVNGSCGSAQGSTTQSAMPSGAAACSAGTQTNTNTLPFSGTNYHTWDCAGLSGGSTASCNASGSGGGGGGCATSPTMEGVCVHNAGEFCEKVCCSGVHEQYNCEGFPAASSTLCSTGCGGGGGGF